MREDSIVSNVGDAAPQVLPNAFSPHMPDGCPPLDAPLAQGLVFRVVKSDPPTPEDFLTYFEEDKVRPDRECDCHGVSVFRDSDDAVAYAEKFQYLGEFIARGSLENQHGKVADTPRIVNGERVSHATWWPFDGLVRHTLFVVLKED
jgi:hypothetical protein